MRRWNAVLMFSALLALMACAARGAGQTDAGGAADASVVETADAGASPGDADGGEPADDPCADSLAGRSAGVREAHALLLSCLDSAATPEVKAQAIDAFVGFADEHGGFPIIDGDTVIFFYVKSATWDTRVGRHSGALTVAGDFNAWTPVPMEHLGEGVTEVELKLPGFAASGGRYKFVSNGTDWFADPLARHFSYDENGEMSLLAVKPAEARFDRYAAVPATRLGNRRTVYVYVPAGYSTSSEPYAVLYMHDGQNLFDPSLPRSTPEVWDVDRIVSEEMAAGRVKPMLVVGVTSTDARLAEYTYTTDLVDGATVGGRGADYEQFLVNELRPMIESRYRVATGPRQTAVLGSSLGGLVSYELALRHPEMFGCVGGMSSTFGWGRAAGHQTVLERYAASTTLSGGGQRFYLDSGGNPNCPTSGTDNVCETYEMKAILESKGFTHYPDDPSAERIDPSTDILHWFELGGTHQESTWGARTFRFLRFCFAP